MYLSETYLLINNYDKAKKWRKAKEYLLRTYMLEGYEIYQDEEDKNFDFIKNEI
jgi:predicted GNAT superfamily acetyltransferase